VKLAGGEGEEEGEWEVLQVASGWSHMVALARRAGELKVWGWGR